MVRDELEKFLTDRAGGLGVVLAMDLIEGSNQKEIEGRVGVSGETVKKRLDEGVEIGIFERTWSPKDHGNSNRYKLTSEGQTLRENFRNYKINNTYQKLRKRQEELDEKIESTIDDLNAIGFHE